MTAESESTSQASTPGVRFTLQGDPREVRTWASLLQNRGTDVMEVASLEEARDAGPSMAIVFAKPAEAQSLVGTAAGSPAAPMALFFSDGSAEHPGTELLRNLVLAKRDWQKAFDAIVDPVLVLDADGCATRVNVALAEALGRDIAGLKGTHYASLLGDSAESPDPIAAALSGGRAATRETRYARLPGVRVVTTSPLADEGGATRGVVVILKDVTEIKEQQERMLLAGQLADVGHLAAGVAHEISTPLASISLRTESLLRSAADPRLQAVDSFRNFPRYLKTIEEEVFRCKRIIGSLLEFSGGNAGRVSDVNVNALAQRAADLVAHQVKVRGLELGLRLEAGLPTIRADEGQVRRALLALLMNAIDATPRGGHVEIETKVGPGSRISLSVLDDGVGIPQENVRHLFSPFFTTKPVGEGTGLGLAVCHGVAASHGGEVRVETRPGAGTRMTLELPVQRANGKEDQGRG